MRVILQKVNQAKCLVDKEVISKIGHGYLLLVGFTFGDNLDCINKMVKKIVNLRIFTDDSDKMNYNIKQVGGQILSISQFTLYANCQNGHRPSFTEALPASDASSLYSLFNDCLKQENIIVKTGVFGKHMEIELINDGPVTINLEF